MRRLLLIVVALAFVASACCGSARCKAEKEDPSYYLVGRVESIQHGFPSDQLTSVRQDERHASWTGLKIEGADLYYRTTQGALARMTIGGCYRFGIGARWTWMLSEYLKSLEQLPDDHCGDKHRVIELADAGEDWLP